MKKIEVISLSLSVVINLALVFILPEMKVEDIGEKKIQVGLVALEKKKKAAVKPKPQPQAKPQKPQPKKEVQKVEEPKSVKPVKSLDSIAKSIEAPKFEPKPLATSNPRFQQTASRAPQNKTLEVKEKKQEEFKFDTNNVVVENIDITPHVAVEKKIETLNGTMDIDFNKILNEEMEISGLPSGYKIGVEEGDMVAQWENSNREPIYPELAQLKGQQGTVFLKLSLDERGNVVNVFLEKGSGIPEINAAIEEIARTWKIYLSKNGLGIKGNVKLEYTFKLQGRN
jgi:protein TonB